MDSARRLADAFPLLNAHLPDHHLYVSQLLSFILDTIASYEYYMTLANGERVYALRPGKAEVRKTSSTVCAMPQTRHRMHLPPCKADSIRLMQRR